MSFTDQIAKHLQVVELGRVEDTYLGLINEAQKLLGKYESVSKTEIKGKQASEKIAEWQEIRSAFESLVEPVLNLKAEYEAFLGETRAAHEDESDFKTYTGGAKTSQLTEILSQLHPIQGVVHAIYETIRVKAEDLATVEEEVWNGLPDFNSDDPLDDQIDAILEIQMGLTSLRTVVQGYHQQETVAFEEIESLQEAHPDEAAFIETYLTGEKFDALGVITDKISPSIESYTDDLQDEITRFDIIKRLREEQKVRRMKLDHWATTQHVEYIQDYVNSFTILKQELERYKDNMPTEHEDADTKAALEGMQAEMQGYVTEIDEILNQRGIELKAIETYNKIATACEGVTFNTPESTEEQKANRERYEQASDILAGFEEDSYLTDDERAILDHQSPLVAYYKSEATGLKQDLDTKYNAICDAIEERLKTAQEAQEELLDRFEGDNLPSADEIRNSEREVTKYKAMYAECQRRG